MGPSLILVFGATAALGVVAFCAVQLNGREVRRAASTFRCALRVVSGNVEAFDAESGTATYARWVRDVLLVWHGFALSRVKALEAVTAGYRVDDVDSREAPGLGSHPVVLTIRLEDGAVVEVAAARRDREKLLQPFAGPRAVHRLRRDPRALEETARLVRRAGRQSKEREEQELPR